MFTFLCISSEIQLQVDTLHYFTSCTLFRFTGWFLHHLFSRLLTGILVHKGQITLLQKAHKVAPLYLYHLVLNLVFSGEMLKKIYSGFKTQGRAIRSIVAHVNGFFSKMCLILAITDQFHFLCSIFCNGKFW